MVLTMVVPILAPAPAHAAVNTGIRISNLKLAKTDAAENPQSGNLVANSSIVLMTFDWDAGSANLKDGDSFSIDLPEELNFRVPQTRAFTHFVDGVETEVGTCVIAQSTMTCTFNGVLPALINQGYNLLSGSGKIQEVAVKATTAEELPFTINGSETVMVDLPGDGGILESQVKYVPDALTKGATGMSEFSTGVTWTIGFGTERLQEEYAKNGVDVTFDGQTVHSIDLTDLLGPGQNYPEDLSNWVLSRRNSATEADPRVARMVLDTGADGSTVTDLGEFTIEVVYGRQTDSGKTARVLLTGPFAPRTNYQLIYSSSATTDDGKAVPGFIYENYVSLDGTSLEREATNSFLDSFSLTVNMQLGYGTFSLDKYVTGPAADHVPAGSAFTVNISYQLPEGATRATYPEWEPPGTLNSDGTGGSASYEVVMGRKNIFVGPKPPVTFPAGTVITLTEATPSVVLPDGYSWGEGKFVVSGVATNSLTIADQQIIGAELTNVVQAEPSTFAVVKNASGAPGVEDKEYTFTYTCSDGQEGTLLVKGDGTPVRETGKSFEVGTTCTIAESAQDAEVSGYELEMPLSQHLRITAGADTVATAQFTNTYIPRTGTFSIAKTVTGDGDFSGDTFAFDYTCSTGESGTLNVPGSGTAVTSPELPAGAVCDVTEQEGSASRQGYSVESTVSGGQVTIVKDETTAVTATNTYSQDKGTFSVAKQVTGDGDFGSATYSVTYECALPDGSTSTDTLSIAGGGKADGPSLPVGTQCTVSEENASRAGYALATSTTVDGQQGSSFTIAKDTTAQVVVTNNYTQRVGGFQIAKTVAGDASDKAPGEFVFDYACTTDDGSNPTGEVNVKAGESVHVEVPVGNCVVTERDASVAGTDLVTAVTVDGQAADSQAEVAVAESSAAAVEFVNTYTAHRGSFSVAKTVEGLAEDAEPGEREFSFSYSCTDGSQGTLSAKADGRAVQPEQTFPVGSQCTITENTGSAGVNGYDLTAPQAQTVSITQKDQVAATSFTNTYAATPSPSPAPTADPGATADPNATADPSASADQSATVAPSATATEGGGTGPLARTGASIQVPAVIALVALAAGAVLLHRRRRA